MLNSVLAAQSEFCGFVFSYFGLYNNDCMMITGTLTTTKILWFTELFSSSSQCFGQVLFVRPVNDNKLHHLLCALCTRLSSIGLLSYKSKLESMATLKSAQSVHIYSLSCYD